MNIIIAMIALLVITFTPAKAESDDNRWVRRSVWSSCDWWGNCTRHRYRKWEHTRRYVRERYRPAVRYYAPPRDDWERREPSQERGVSCKGEMVRVVGGAHLTEKGAINDAIRAWQSTIRYDYGERYMSLENARDYRWRCDRASTNESTVGRAAESLTGGDGFQRRCVIIARPCRKPTESGEKD